VSKSKRLEGFSKEGIGRNHSFHKLTKLGEILTFRLAVAMRQPLA
jgi:hypothetical protein